MDIDKKGAAKSLTPPPPSEAPSKTDFGGGAKEESKAMKLGYDIGVSEEPNLSKSRPTMEDAHYIKPDFLSTPLWKSEWLFAGVYNGYGGSEASRYAAENLHTIFSKYWEITGDEAMDKKVEKAFYNTYKKISEEINKFTSAGTTAANIFITYKIYSQLHCANAGDTRIILIKKDSTEQLSYDHKASDSREKERIKDSGGYVNPAGYVVSGSMGLAVPRALGDPEFDKRVIPFYTTSKFLTNEDIGIIIACDGVWDVMSNEEAAEIVRNNDAQDAAEMIKDTAISKGTEDNITVIVVKFVRD